VRRGGWLKESLSKKLVVTIMRCQAACGGAVCHPEGLDAVPVHGLGLGFALLRGVVGDRAG
jgi:hypothetical protein